MGKIEEIERQIAELSPQEFAELRAKFADLDAAAWDAQLVRDVADGKLKALADAARRASAEGKSTDL